MTYDVAIANLASPYVTAYPWTPGTGFGAKYSDPAITPAGGGNGVAFMIMLIFDKSPLICDVGPHPRLRTIFHKRLRLKRE